MLKELQNIYDEINDTIFEGDLPDVYFDLNTWTDCCAATWEHETGNIVISFSTEFNYDTFEIMAHEIIHVYQFANKLKEKAHGKTFKRFAKKISKEYNISVSEYYEI